MNEAINQSYKHVLTEPTIINLSQVVFASNFINLGRLFCLACVFSNGYDPV